MLESGWDKKKIAFNNDIIKIFAEHKPAIHFKPGEKWEYSNTAYAMLASIIERVSGKTYGEFLSENIFVPLDMKRTRTYNTRRSGEVIDNYAYGFIYSDSLKKYALPDSLKEYYYVYPLDGIQGDGVVNSTTGDLFKWDQALYTEKLVSKATLEEAFTSGKTKNDSVYNYGFGWMVAKDRVSGNLTQHSGSWPGYRTLIVRFVDHGDCIIILSNTENPNARSTVGKEIKKRLDRYREPRQGT
jgi:CubicO group peptidase (beta-lactamase class C family)